MNGNWGYTIEKLFMDIRFGESATISCRVRIISYYVIR